MSERRFIVCDACQREVKPGEPTKETTPVVHAYRLIDTNTGAAYLVDVCDQCAETVTLKQLSAKLLDDIHRVLFRQK